MDGRRARPAPQEPYTAIPNRLLRSAKLDVYDKLIAGVLASCNPSWPSYERLMEWTGMSRARVWKSLRRLEELGLISRYERGRGVEYVLWWDESSAEAARARGEQRRFTRPDPAPELRPADEREDFRAGIAQVLAAIGPREEFDSSNDSAPAAPLDDGSPAETSSPDELVDEQPVHHVNPTSSPGELEPVHQVNPKKNKEKASLKKADTAARQDREPPSAPDARAGPG